MNKKYLIAAVIFVIISSIAGIGAWYYSSLRETLSFDGEPTFARTKAKIAYLSRIKFTRPDGSEVNLYRQDGLWRFEEAKNYFANLGQLNNLLRMLNDSTIIATDEVSTRRLKQLELDSSSGVLLQTYALDGKLLNEMIIGKKGKHGLCYARLPRSEKYVYRISNCGTFSGDAASWVPYPLLSLPYHLIARIKTPEDELYHDDIMDRILKSQEVRRFILALGNLDYQGIMLKTERPTEEDANIETREIEVEMANGLVYVFKIHRFDDSYWLETDMKIGRIARKSVETFIENNRKYFDDWLFLLNDTQGKLLFEFEG